jgi:hypothetical protein
MKAMPASPLRRPSPRTPLEHPVTALGHCCAKNPKCASDCSDYTPVHGNCQSLSPDYRLGGLTVQHLIALIGLKSVGFGPLLS